MKFSVQVLAIAATVFSMNAVPQAIEPAHGTGLHSRHVVPEATVAALEPAAPQAPQGAAWPLALGFLVIVVMRRIRS